MALNFNRLLISAYRAVPVWAVVCGSVCAPGLAQTPREPATPVLIRPDAVAAWDSVARAQPAAVAGFRIQVFLGDLQAARQLRAELRRQQPLPVYVLDLAPNYRVCLGDFRDRFSAEFVRAQWLTAYPTATVIPCSIEPPALPVAP